MAALISTRGLGRRSTESTLNPTFGLGFGVLAEPGETVTDVIGITDDADRTVAYVRVVTDGIGIVDIVVVPVEIPEFTDETERLLDRADPIRSIRPDDITRLLDGIDEYLRETSRTRVDIERIMARLDPGRWICELDTERITVTLDTMRAIRSRDVERVVAAIDPDRKVDPA